MPRRFAEHDLRAVQCLDGIWDFAFLGDVCVDDLDAASIVYDDRMAVPGCFDATPRYAGRRGLTAYRTTVRFRDTARHRLRLDGVHHWCRVLLDGRVLGEHVTGFVPFNLDFTPAKAGPAELVVLVDNRFDSARVPTHLEYFDWYHYGGIARGAELHRLGEAWIESIRLVTEDLAARRVSVTVRYGSASDGKAPVSIRLGERTMVDEQADLCAGGGELRYTFDAPHAEPWSPEAPNLCELYVTLGEDDCRQRVGLRTVQARGRELLLNGKPLRLLGFCRHEGHPQFGHALTEQLLVADVQQLRDMGCNFVRGSHYPQDPRFLDLCDEAGICVWSESIGWQHGPQHLTDENFLAAQLTNIDEMVAATDSHPSVICWGILNESHSHDPACRPAYERLLGRLRELDPTRPVTYACNHPFDDVCLDLVDVVGVNCYPGWYVEQIEDIPAEIDKIVRHLNAHGQADKPLIISEIGAGAIYGWRDWQEERWTEQYQARLLEMTIRTLFQDRSDVCGLSIWQFCDVRTSPRKLAMGRPRTFNNKGVLDEYRRAKLACEVVKRLFGDLAGA